MGGAVSLDAIEEAPRPLPPEADRGLQRWFAGAFIVGPLTDLLDRRTMYTIDLFAGVPGIWNWLYPNELFPTSIRASAVGMAVAFSRIGAAVGTYLVPVSLTHFGLAPTMYAGGLITVIGLIACLAWAEETKGRSLAEVSAGTASTPAGARAQTAPAVPRLDR
jgi:hypothetical protein